MPLYGWFPPNRHPACRGSGVIPEHWRSRADAAFPARSVRNNRPVALQQKREDRTDGGYSICTWDNDFGHAVIWEYDSDDQLQRRGIITHLDGPQGSSEA